MEYIYDVEKLCTGGSCGLLLDAALLGFEEQFCFQLSASAAKVLKLSASKKLRSLLGFDKKYDKLQH